LTDEGDASDRLVTLGRVTGPYGLQGWLKIHSETDPRDNIVRYATWWLGRGGHWERRAVEAGRPHGKTVVARIEGVDDRDQAAAFIGLQIGVERAALPATDKDQYYWSDLEGLTVVNKAGAEIGRVAYLLETGANDVMVVDKAGREVLIPFVTGDIVRDVDLDGGTIRVDWEWD